jgi:hypothetical protein
VRLGGTAILRSALPVVIISLAACHTAVLSPAGPVGEGDRIKVLDSLAIMIASAVPESNSMATPATVGVVQRVQETNARVKIVPARRRSDILDHAYREWSSLKRRSAAST